MGWGDEIMAAGEVVRAQRADPRIKSGGKPRPVAILGADGQPRWHEIWQNNPRIATPAQVAGGLDCQSIVNGGNARPYMLSKTRERYRFDLDYRAAPGEICFSMREATFAAASTGGPSTGSGQAVVIEPNIGRGRRPNKDWGWDRWQALVRLLPGVEWWQLGPAEAPTLEGVRRIVTPGFREACAILARARAAVLPEGGLHHAAAALGVPAVVIFGGFIAPSITGYSGHVNIARLHDDEGIGCGWRVPCNDCMASMAAITPEEVAEKLEGLLCSSTKGFGCRTASSISSLG